MKKTFQTVTTLMLVLTFNQIANCQKSTGQKTAECAGVVAMGAAAGFGLGAPLGGIGAPAGAASFGVITFATHPACSDVRDRLNGAAGSGSGSSSGSGGGGGYTVQKTYATRLHKY